LSDRTFVDGKTWVDVDVYSLHFCKMGAKDIRHS
jgi:hypothetical protein